MNLEQNLQQAIQNAFEALYQYKIEQVSFQTTKKDFEGTHTFVTFPFTKNLQQKPADIAEALGAYLVEHTHLVEKYNVANGFLKLTLKDSVWLAVFKDIYQNPHFGNLNPNGKKVVVEYSSPNTNKPLHLGHLRNNFLGYAVAEILKMAGYEVHKTQILNDRGIHICKSMLAYQKFSQQESPVQFSEKEELELIEYADQLNKAEDTDETKEVADTAHQFLNQKGDHLVGKYYVHFDKVYKEQMESLTAQGMSKDEAMKEAPIFKEAQEMLQKWEQNDAAVVALWEKMNGWVYEGFNRTYQTIGVNFDSYYYESKTYLLGKDIIEEGLEKGIFYKQDNGSVWIDLTDENLDQKLVLRADGTSVYITQDIGTAELRYQSLGMDKMIYVVGNEQEYHFKVLFTILQKLGKNYANDLHHLSYGMVDLPSGRMKTREGTVVDADLLVAQVVAIARERTIELGKIEDLTEEEALKLYKTIGLGALKYFLLKVDPRKRMLYNPQESIDFQGDTAPYIQFNYVRTASVKRTAERTGVTFSNNIEGYTQLAPSETDIIKHLNDFPKYIREAAESLSPSVIAQYVYELTRLFSSFWTQVSILKAETEEARNFRIMLSDKVAYTIKKGMEMLGIDVPEKM